MPLLKNSSLSRAFLRLKNGGDAYKNAIQRLFNALIERLAVVMGENDREKAYKSFVLPKLYAAYAVFLPKSDYFVLNSA